MCSHYARVRVRLSWFGYSVKRNLWRDHNFSTEVLFVIRHSTYLDPDDDNMAGQLACTVSIRECCRKMNYGRPVQQGVEYIYP